MTTSPTGSSTTIAAPDLAAAADLVALADTLISGALAALRETGGPDTNQVFAYDIAHAASAAATARVLLDYGAKGDTEAAIACAFAADMLHDLLCRVAGYKVPKSIVFASALQRNGAGKLLKNALRDLYANTPAEPDPSDGTSAHSLGGTR